MLVSCPEYVDIDSHTVICAHLCTGNDCTGVNPHGNRRSSQSEAYCMKGDIAGALARRVDDIRRDTWRRRDSSKPLGRHGVSSIASKLSLIRF